MLNTFGWFEHQFWHFTLFDENDSLIKETDPSTENVVNVYITDDWTVNSDKGFDRNNELNACNGDGHNSGGDDGDDENDDVNGDDCHDIASTKVMR